MKQIGNVAALPGIVHVSRISPRLKSKKTTKKKKTRLKTLSNPYSVTPQKSIGLPDVHAGYGFAIGNMAAFDMSDPAAVVSPGSFSRAIPKAEERL